ncbi:MAG: T9SS type A sorting domain-containing protein [Bacteroidales bacterium]|nr:T9SS type A sorting domain-containing protein [Bacteroidales bacterium]
MKSSGTYMVTVENEYQCKSTDSIAIVVKARPEATLALSGPTRFYEGETVELQAGLADKYQWSTGDTTQSINVTASGSFVVTVSNANACSATSQTVVVSVFPLPLKPEISQSNDTLIAVPTNAGGAYNWYLNSQKIITTAKPRLKLNETGMYYVVVADSNGCSVTSEEFYSVYTSLTDGSSKITVYPNPAVEYVQISTTDIDKLPLSLNVFDANGKNVFGTFTISESLFEINVGQLSAGVYMFQISSNNELIKIERVTIER